MRLILGVVWLNPYLPNGLFHPYILDKSISSFRGIWSTFSSLFHFLLKILYANSADPDQTPRSAASDLGLHCLHRSQKGDARLIWVKVFLVLRQKVMWSLFKWRKLTKWINLKIEMINVSHIVKCSGNLMMKSWSRVYLSSILINICKTTEAPGLRTMHRQVP